MKRTILIGMALALAGCGGGSGSSTPPPPVVPPPPIVNASPGGIWSGTTSSGQGLFGIVTETGEFHFALLPGPDFHPSSQDVGTVTVTGNSATASFTDIPNFESFGGMNEMTAGTGTLTGIIAERSTLTGSTHFTSTTGVVSDQTFSLTYDAQYDLDSSLATISGGYQGNGGVVNIDSNGAIFSQDARTGCVINGTVFIIDERYNAYRIQYTFDSCTGTEAVFNGVTFTGLAYRLTGGIPEQIQLMIFITATVGNANYALLNSIGRL